MENMEEEQAMRNRGRKRSQLHCIKVQELRTCGMG